MLVLLSVVFTSTMANDSTGVAINPSGDDTPLWQLIASLVLVVIEITFRLIPTAKDYSILNFIVRILNYLVPNKSTETKYNPNVKKRIVNKLFKIKAD